MLFKEHFIGAEPAKIVGDPGKLDDTDIEKFDTEQKNSRAES